MLVGLEVPRQLECPLVGEVADRLEAVCRSGDQLGRPVGVRAPGPDGGAGLRGPGQGELALEHRARPVLVGDGVQGSRGKPHLTEGLDRLPVPPEIGVAVRLRSQRLRHRNEMVPARHGRRRDAAVGTRELPRQGRH